jgi:hypothetical protein
VLEGLAHEDGESEAAIANIIASRQARS